MRTGEAYTFSAAQSVTEDRPGESALGPGSLPRPPRAGRGSRNGTSTTRRKFGRPGRTPFQSTKPAQLRCVRVDVAQDPTPLEDAKALGRRPAF